MSKQPGIFCLEGEWSDLLTDRTSVEPQLRMLENMKQAEVIHRDVATREELSYYLAKWSQKRYAGFPLAYLAFHGGSGRLQLGRDEVTLAELAEIAGPRLAGRTVYFGSCSVMAANDQELMAFCRDTGAKAVVGYTKTIDFLESAAFDFILLPKLLNATFVKPILKGLRRDHERFVVGLGLLVHGPQAGLGRSAGKLVIPIAGGGLPGLSSTSKQPLDRRPCGPWWMDSPSCGYVYCIVG